MEQAIVNLTTDIKKKENILINRHEVINIPDFNLKKALNTKFNSPDDAPITKVQLESLLALNLTGVGINNLEGLQYCKNLSYLGLSKNEISDLSPICNLKELVTLNIDENKINNITYLQNLTNLTYLTLSENYITNLEPLKKLTNLNYLDLSSNQIENLSPLSKLTNLVCLSLNNNRVRNLNTLNGLNNIGLLDLQNQEIVLNNYEFNFDSSPIEVNNIIRSIDGSFIHILDNDISSNGIYNIHSNTILWNDIYENLEYHFSIKKIMNSEKSEFSGKVVLPYKYIATPIDKIHDKCKDNNAITKRDSFKKDFSLINMLKKIFTFTGVAIND
ncbi:leucine-rich repeat domain-containing protein [Paraclostridium benzoelyticum]|uniref:leucine-rich repeat domain-containing protein n=1 Tax=Paraclostridium benzoelyticum TaxID=1629550 RepID=UPI00069BB22E|nr:leucine-rich repeat domain-containing protein [Paraclostridium benzoelyticum]